MSLLGIQRHGSGPLLVWLHGFTQTKDSAHEFRSILAGTYEVLTLDLPGHGANAKIHATLEETAAMLDEVLPGDPFVLAGYSFGARVALHFALRYPQRLSRLVLLGGTRGIELESLRVARRQHDEALADRIEAIGTERFLEEWLSQPMFSALARDESELAARSREASGLAASLRLAGTGTQRWLGDDLRELDVSTLAIAGELDHKFAAEAVAISRTVAKGSSALVRGALHAAHVERPRPTAELITSFHLQ